MEARQRSQADNVVHAREIHTVEEIKGFDHAFQPARVSKDEGFCYPDIEACKTRPCSSIAAGKTRTVGIGLRVLIRINSHRNEHDLFIQRYIFPGSNQPRLSEITNNLEHNRLPTVDVENLIRHYGYTGKAWLERFRSNKEKLNPEKYGIKFKRMWEYYLCCIVAAARSSDAALYQILFTNSYTADVPLNRV